MTEDRSVRAESRREGTTDTPKGRLEIERSAMIVPGDYLGTFQFSGSTAVFLRTEDGKKRLMFSMGIFVVDEFTAEHSWKLSLEWLDERGYRFMSDNAQHFVKFPAVIYTRADKYCKIVCIGKRCVEQYERILEQNPAKLFEIAEELEKDPTGWVMHPMAERLRKERLKKSRRKNRKEVSEEQNGCC